MRKIFVIGLPRTGTTSVCAAFLKLGYNVAHTAYTDAVFDRADVVGDTPVFHEFETLDQCFPGSKFIYLSREERSWLPSIKTLLGKIEEKGTRDQNAFHPVFTRCFREVFGVFDPLVPFEKCLLDDALSARLAIHRARVHRYFKTRPQDLLSIEVSQPGGVKALSDFLNITDKGIDNFDLLNKDGVISDWDKIMHPNKINSNLKNAAGRRVLTYI